MFAVAIPNPLYYREITDWKVRRAIDIESTSAATVILKYDTSYPQTATQSNLKPDGYKAHFSAGSKARQEP